MEPDWRPYDKAKDLGPEDPPPGHGPALEWFADAKSTMWGAAAVGLAIFAAFATWRWGGFGWMEVWYMWVVLLACTSLFLLGRKSTRMTVGADWLIVHKMCVDTYRLRSIRVTTGVNTHNLELTDGKGNKIDTQVYYLQKNRKLWDLVYNGILHSIVHHGADVNRRAVEHLQLQAVIRKPPIDR